MPPVNQRNEISLEQQIECVERELKLRENVYKRKVKDYPSTRPHLEYEYRAMKAVLETLKKMKYSGARTYPFDEDGNGS